MGQRQTNSIEVRTMLDYTYMGGAHIEAWQKGIMTAQHLPCGNGKSLLFRHLQLPQLTASFVLQCAKQLERDEREREMSKRNKQ